MIAASRCIVTAALAMFVQGWALAQQANLFPDTDINGPKLEFDWPAVQVAIGSYEQGPTGLTIIRFGTRALATADVRGGVPGTINTDLLRTGWELPYLDAIVFSGGSVYGEEAITAVSTGLKDNGTRGSAPNDLGLVAGAVIYDFQGHRLNEIYPDKALARAAMKAFRPGVFPLGAQGAGRMAMQGSFLGCGAHSGQGAAFRQIGGTKIAAFVVVNARGSITDRDGRLVSCHQGQNWNASRTSELLARLPITPPASGPSPVGTVEGAGPRNTTLSLVVTNRKLGYADLQRLAVQVHTSMARAIQPFSTFEDGDTLFAVSTEEVAEPRPRTIDLNSIAGEVMWDAILASVPAEEEFTPSSGVTVSVTQLASYAGTYQFAANAIMKVRLEQDHLMVESFSPPFFDLRPRNQVQLRSMSETEFYVDSRYHTRLAFVRGEDGNVTSALVNPGRWQQVGRRVRD
jgi:L-aminopeptidase/D-esterase-like protein